MASDALARFPQMHASLIDRVFAKISVAQPFMAVQILSDALKKSAEHHFAGKNPSSSDVSSYLETLHHDDLALAAACAQGLPAAWDYFVKEFRPVLYAAGRAIAGEAGRELADSLYAELFGLEERDGRRRSLFLYFHGRSKLSTWLRSVLAQRHVDAFRATKKTVSLDEPDSQDDSKAAPLLSSIADKSGNSNVSADPDRSRLLVLLQVALTSALAALAPQDRLRLSYYYIQDLTLAQIGRLLREHEATVSRKLDRTRRDLCASVEKCLSSDKKLSEAQVRLCFDYAQEEWPFDLTRPLSK